jgi:hypothetical protein
MMGWNRDVNALDQDAQNILTMRDAGVAVPSELAKADHAQARQYLRDNSCLRIPDDQVRPVQEAIAKDIQNFPANYHLPENPSQEQVDHVLGRIRGIGVTSPELEQMIGRRLGG